MSTLVFLEHHGDEVLKSSLGVLSKAASLGRGDVAGVVLGSNVRGLAEGAGAFGAAKVYVADDPQLEAPLPQPRVDVLAQLIRDRGVDTVLFANSVLAADVASLNSPCATPRLRMPASHVWCALKKRSTCARIAAGNAGISPANAPHRHTRSGVLANCR